MTQSADGPEAHPQPPHAAIRADEQVETGSSDGDHPGEGPQDDQPESAAGAPPQHPSLDDTDDDPWGQVPAEGFSAPAPPWYGQGNGYPTGGHEHGQQLSPGPDALGHPADAAGQDYGLGPRDARGFPAGLTSHEGGAGSADVSSYPAVAYEPQADSPGADAADSGGLGGQGEAAGYPVEEAGSGAGSPAAGGQGPGQLAGWGGPAGQVPAPGYPGSGSGEAYGPGAESVGPSGGSYGPGGGHSVQGGGQHGEGGGQYGPGPGQAGWDGAGGGQHSQGAEQHPPGDGQYGQGGGQYGPGVEQPGQGGEQFGQGAEQHAPGGGQYGQGGGQYAPGGEPHGQGGGRYGQQVDQYGYGAEQYPPGSGPYPQSQPPVGARPEVVNPFLEQSNAIPRRGMRRAVYRATFGAVNLGPSEEERAARDRRQRVARPLHGSWRVVVMSIKGGVGKTTTAAMLGRTLAEWRGDRVVALDTNPDMGTLGDRLVGATDVTVRGLLAHEARSPIQQVAEVNRFTNLAGRLHVLANEQDPAVSEDFTGLEYQQTLNILERFYNVIIADCGTGVLRPWVRDMLSLANTLVVVAEPKGDAATRAAGTLDWIAQHGFHDLVARSVAVINYRSPTPKSLDVDKLTEFFAQRCRAVCKIRYDEHLDLGVQIQYDPIPDAPAEAYVADATKEDYLGLAAIVADEFR